MLLQPASAAEISSKPAALNPAGLNLAAIPKCRFPADEPFTSAPKRAKFRPIR